MKFVLWLIVVIPLCSQMLLMSMDCQKKVTFAECDIEINSAGKSLSVPSGERADFLESPMVMNKRIDFDGVSQAPPQIMTAVTDTQSYSGFRDMFCFPLALGLAVPPEIVGEAIIGIVQLSCNSAACALPLGHLVVAAISCGLGSLGAYRILYPNDCTPQ
jgi:hypothetical protein